MAIRKHYWEIVLFIFLLSFIHGSESFIRSYVKSSSIRLELKDANTSLSEISYSAEASSVTHLLRFNDKTRSAYTVTSLKANTTYIFNITFRAGEQQRVNETTITLTTNKHRDNDDDDVHRVFLFLTIIMGSLLCLLIFIICVMVWKGCFRRPKPKKHIENNSSIVQRMRRRQRDRERQLAKIPNEDISNYTNSIPGWNAK